jgi:hypothetical protein
VVAQGLDFAVIQRAIVEAHVAELAAEVGLGAEADQERGGG